MNIKLYLWWISFIALAFLPDANGGGDGGGGEEVTEGAIENLFEKLSASNADDDEPEDPLQQYFYLTDPELPIVEYEGLAEGEEDKPDFIYNPESVKGVRLVEFYAHWCPHCQKFREHYIEFAREMEKLSKKHSLDYGTYAVSCVHHSSLCTDQEVKGYPRVKLFQAGETFGKFLNVWELHPAEMLRELSVDFNLSEEEESFSVEQKKEKQGMETNQDGKLDFLPRSKTDIYNDAQLSFDFAMKNAIFTDRKRLSEEKEKALKEWLQLMKAALPPGWSLQTLVSDLYENIESIAKSEKNLLKIVKKHPPKKKSWSHSCRKGDGMAGYTCGLWELFHIVSIGVVEWNSMVVGDDDWPFYRPEESAETLRNYIENFFGCEVCRLNFMHAFDSCAFQRCDRLTKYVGELEDWKELPMWLFEMHNGVNVRLMREQAEENHRVPTREDEIAVQWPSTSECPLCWHADGRWDPDKVYTFLRLTYWPDDETSASARRSLFVEELEEEDDYEEEEGSPRIFLLVIFGSLIITGGSWYRKRLLLARTGYHKKVDDSAV